MQAKPSARRVAITYYFNCKYSLELYQKASTNLYIVPRNNYYD